jgi:hypothetical protein
LIRSTAAASRPLMAKMQATRKSALILILCSPTLGSDHRYLAPKECPVEPLPEAMTNPGQSGPKLTGRKKERRRAWSPLLGSLVS